MAVSDDSKRPTASASTPIPIWMLTEPARLQQHPVTNVATVFVIAVTFLLVLGVYFDLKQLSHPRVVNSGLLPGVGHHHPAPAEAKALLETLLEGVGKPVETRPLRQCVANS